MKERRNTYLEMILKIVISMNRTACQKSIKSHICVDPWKMRTSKFEVFFHCLITIRKIWTKNRNKFISAHFKQIHIYKNQFLHKSQFIEWDLLDSRGQTTRSCWYSPHWSIWMITEFSAWIYIFKQKELWIVFSCQQTISYFFFDKIIFIGKSISLLTIIA